MGTDTSVSAKGPRQLFAGILQNSESSNLGQAIKEWDYQGSEFPDIDESDEESRWTTCECGHRIVERCVIRNKKNDNTLTVGNCCVNIFAPDAVKISHTLKKGRLSKPLIERALKDGVVLQHAHDFLIEVHRKKVENLSEKQQKWLASLRKRIIARYKLQGKEAE